MWDTGIVSGTGRGTKVADLTGHVADIYHLALSEDGSTLARDGRGHHTFLGCRTLGRPDRVSVRSKSSRDGPRAPWRQVHGSDGVSRLPHRRQAQAEPVEPGLAPAGPPTTESRSTTKISVEPAGIKGDGDCLP